MSITPQRLKWLQDNKGHGDVAKVVKNLNPKATPKGITYSEALSIINGNLWGKWGNAFCNELERLITKRNKKEQREKAKYQTT